MSESVGHVSPTLSDDIERQLADIDDKHHLWLHARTEFDENDDTLLIVLTIPDDDPFEPTRLDRIFDSVEATQTTSDHPPARKTAVDPLA